MPKPTIDDVFSIKDPMLNDNFDFTFGRIPGNGISTRNLTVQCKSAVKPGMTVDQVEFALFGHKVRHAAKKTFSPTFTLEIYENSKGDVSRGIENWVNEIRGTQSQHGLLKADYAVKGSLTAYTQTGSIAAEWEIINCWPTEYPETQFDGEGGTAITHSITFAYDIYNRKR